MAVRGAGGAAWTRFTFPLRINVASGTSAEEYLTDLVLGFGWVLEAAYFIPSGDGAGAAATRPFRVLKGTATVAASKTIVLADTETADKGIPVTFTNGTLEERTFGPADTLSIDVTAVGTSFTTLTGSMVIVGRQQRQSID